MLGARDSAGNFSARSVQDLYITSVGYWPMGYVVCNVWQVMDVMLCTSSIWHMCTISIDRYIGIRYPLKAAAAARLNQPICR